MGGCTDEDLRGLGLNHGHENILCPLELVLVENIVFRSSSVPRNR